MGESSRLYLELYQAGLIDSSFAAGYEDMPGVALLSCGGDSRNPEAVRTPFAPGRAGWLPRGWRRSCSTG